MKKILFSLLSLVTFSFSYDQPFIDTLNSCDVCPTNWVFDSVIEHPPTSSWYSDGELPTSATLYGCNTSEAKMSLYVKNEQNEFVATLYNYINFDTTFTCSTCPVDTVYNSVTAKCEAPVCPPGTHDDLSNPEVPNCVCDSGVPLYDLNGFVGCEQAECPSTYNGEPPLPLFASVSNSSQCNFFSYADGAILDLNGVICCYGQEGLEPDTCPINTVEINGACYPIEDNEDNSTDPWHCGGGQYYSMELDQCVDYFPNDDGNDSNDGTPTNNSGTADTDENGTITNKDLFGDESMAFEDYSGDGSEFGIDLDGVQGALEGVLSSYVLVQIPITANGTCHQELSKTFSMMGYSYTIDLATHMQQFNNFAPILKALIIFMFGFGGVIIVLASAKD